MHVPGIERSRMDDRWCVFTPTTETLCPWWAVPMVFLFLIFT